MFVERKAVKIYTAPDNLQAEMILEVFGKKDRKSVV